MTPVRQRAQTLFRRTLLAGFLAVIAAGCGDSGNPITPPPPPPVPPPPIPPPPPPPTTLPDTVDRLGTWTVVLERPISSKYEGLSFADATRGWLIADQGDILVTTDGGVSWTPQGTSMGHLRSLEAVDGNVAFTGTLQGIMYRTLNGGATWTNITDRFPSVPIGFCGITHVGNTVHVVGRYANAADYYRSYDGGETWQLTNFGATAQGLVDVVFLDEQVGFIGGRANNATSPTGSAIIYRTTDGGVTWTPVFIGNYGTGWAWKIFPVNANVIYAALASTDGTYRVGKSTDGGDTWTVQIVVSGQQADLRSGVQGIGFLDENVGWVGGFFGGMYATTNGGANWHPVGTPGSLVNRYRRVGGTLFTASTEGVLRYDPK